MRAMEFTKESCVARKKTESEEPSEAGLH